MHSGLGGLVIIVAIAALIDVEPDGRVPLCRVKAMMRSNLLIRSVTLEKVTSLSARQHHLPLRRGRQRGVTPAFVAGRRQ